MNALQKAYLDGASLAYKDCAAKIRSMIDRAPPEIKDFIKFMEPMANACELKAIEVYKEAERMESATRQ